MATSNPKITWHYNQMPIQNSVYLGNFENTKSFSLEVEIWNNRYGSEDVKDLSEGRLVFEFKDYEDSILLNHLLIQFDQGAYSVLSVEGSRGHIYLPKTLSGVSNTGQKSNYANYITAKIIFNRQLNLKNNLKSLILDIQ